MKKAFSIFLVLVMLLSLCACGGKEEAPEASEAPADVPAAAPTEAENTPVEAPEEAPAEAPADEPVEEDPVEIVRGYIDQPIEDLYAVIGQPESSDYAPSCMGEGEDGMLFYDGFIVYTYREGEVETVYDVE